MSVWNGWQSDLLKTAGFPNSAANQQFLTAWHQHATSNCKLNPVDISKQVSGYSVCHHLDPGRTANNYPSQAAAEAAFKGQVFGSEYITLNAGFFNNDLDVTNASASLVAEIQTWGSADFAAYLQNQTTAASGGSAGVKSPGIHKGWSELRKSVSGSLIGAVSDSGKLTRTALRSLERARRVKL